MPKWRDMEHFYRHLGKDRSDITEAQAIAYAKKLAVSHPETARIILELVLRCVEWKPEDPTAPKKVQLSVETTKELMASLNSMAIAVRNGAVPQHTLVEQVDQLRMTVALEMQHPEWIAKPLPKFLKIA